MAGERGLIVNADDYGRSSGINRGVVKAHERGIVTSASLMVRWPAAVEAAEYCRNRPDFSLGLHVDLAEWVYVDGAWAPRYEVVPADDASAIAKEVARQHATFRRLTGRDPTHLDSHQHVHRSDAVGAVLREHARNLDIPLREHTPQVRYCGVFYGQTATGAPLPDHLSVKALVRVLQTLAPGVTELGCHPGEGDDLDSSYRAERAIEVTTLCDPEVRATIVAEGIVLRSFHGISTLMERSG